jgi:hypothetical protein
MVLLGCEISESAIFGDINAVMCSVVLAPLSIESRLAETWPRSVVKAGVDSIEPTVDLLSQSSNMKVLSGNSPKKSTGRCGPQSQLYCAHSLSSSLLRYHLCMCAIQRL